MSKINDALKRAKDAQRENTPSSVPPLPPIEARPQERGANWILPGAIFFLIIVAVLLFATSAAMRLSKTTIAEPVAAPTQAVITAVAPEPLPVVTNLAASPAKVPQPVRVQGIVSDPVHPWAIISGKTVYVGDLVDGMRVTAISREAITLVGNGQTNKLTVGQ
jgi:hypothetical protein